MADVGIVMPVYKQKSSYLLAALRSILKQSYRNFRLIVVIDGVTPNVLNIVKKAEKLDQRVHVILEKENKGVASALNKGFQPLKEDKNIEFLTWVSSDNIYYPHFISTLRDNLKNSPDDIGFVYSSFRHINSRGKALYNRHFIRKFKNFQNQPKEKLLDLCFIGVSFIYRKSYAMEVGDYNREPVEDYDYWLRMTDRCDIRYVPRQLMDYRVSSPYSISAKLKGSLEEHRRWRFAFQSTKNDARKRRGIPYETTVIFPVRETSDVIVDQMEMMLEQYYSNYKFIIIDCTANGGAIKRLGEIPDPRVTLISCPSANNIEAVKVGLKYANTSFVLLYSGNIGPLQELVERMRGVQKKVVAVNWTPDTIIEHIYGIKELLFQRLYRTQALKQFVNNLKKMDKCMEVIF